MKEKQVDTIIYLKEVTINFMSMDIEDHDTCEYDVLSISDGVDSNENYCGNILPSQYSSKTGFIQIEVKEPINCWIKTLFIFYLF